LAQEKHQVQASELAVEVSHTRVSSSISLSMSRISIVLTFLACAAHSRRVRAPANPSEALVTLLRSQSPAVAFTGAAPAQRFATQNAVGIRAKSPLAYNGGWSWNKEPAWKSTAQTSAAVAPATTQDTPVAAEPATAVVESTEAAAAPKKKGKKKNRPTPTGLFAPAVLATKSVMGDKELNALRADVIKAHTKVISKFVDTSESKFGQIVLKNLFAAADKDNSGTLDREEIKEALFALGFTFVKDKDLDSIMKKADVDQNEVIDFEEFVATTPVVLRQQLVRLAKANGHDLGFLA